jgi:hypothetical protein
MNDTKLRFWRNDKRDSSAHPHLTSSKPQEINGQRCWLSLWINSDNEETQKSIDRMVQKLADECGTGAIITVGLRPAEQQAPAERRDYGTDGGDDPF